MLITFPFSFSERPHSTALFVSQGERAELLSSCWVYELRRIAFLPIISKKEQKEEIT